MFSKIKNSYLTVCQKTAACLHAPSKSQAQFLMFAAGIALISAGTLHEAVAQGTFQGQGVTITYNDARISDSTNAVLTYLEGSFGALVMVASGIGAILSAAFGQYRAALGLMVVAIGSFILRSLMSTFFNDVNIQS